VAEAKVLTTEISLQASEKLFELAGSRATLAEFNLDRHWRNARAHPARPGALEVPRGRRLPPERHLPARHSWI
jgi:alkylation response protein AidB-like acyl-CoA dehydrogenase